jgi:hypothetical protein
LETSISIWRSPKNPAIGALEDLYRDMGDTVAMKALQERAKTFKRPRY